jgi:hypothetical protein
MPLRHVPVLAPASAGLVSAPPASIITAPASVAIKVFFPERNIEELLKKDV